MDHCTRALQTGAAIPAAGLHRALTSRRPRWRRWGSWWSTACCWGSRAAGSRCNPLNGTGTYRAGTPGTAWKPWREKGKAYFPPKPTFVLAVRRLKLIDKQPARGTLKKTCSNTSASWHSCAFKFNVLLHEIHLPTILTPWHCGGFGPSVRSACIGWWVQKLFAESSQTDKLLHKLCFFWKAGEKCSRSWMDSN